MSRIMCSFIEKYKYQRGNVFDSNVHSQILRIQPEAFLTPVVLPCVRGFYDPAQTICLPDILRHDVNTPQCMVDIPTSFKRSNVGRRNKHSHTWRYYSWICLGCLEKVTNILPNGALPWYKVKSHLKQIKGDWNTKHGPKSVVRFKHQISFRFFSPLP